MPIGLFVPEQDDVPLPIFWRSPDGWVLRLAYRLWLCRWSS